MVSILFSKRGAILRLTSSIVVTSVDTMTAPCQTFAKSMKESWWSQETISWEYHCCHYLQGIFLKFHCLLSLSSNSVSSSDRGGKMRAKRNFWKGWSIAVLEGLIEMFSVFIVDHRFIVNRQQGLAHRLRNRIKTRAFSCCKNNSFHIAPSDIFKNCW